MHKKKNTTLRELSFIALSDNRPLKFLRSHTGRMGERREGEGVKERLGRRTKARRSAEERKMSED